MQWIVAKYDNRIKNNFTVEKSEELGQLREASRVCELFLTYLVKNVILPHDLPSPAPNI